MTINMRELQTALHYWAASHKGEILWAATFAVVFAWPVARIIDPPKHEPLKIRILIDPDTDADTRRFFSDLSLHHELSVGDFPVQLQADVLDDNTDESVTRKAEELRQRSDTLLVIGHLSSQLVEASLPIFFSERPQIPFIATTASDDDLLTKCRPDSRCYDDTFVPLLQLSPTNSDQAQSAVRFAIQNGKKRFLIVSEDDPNNHTYTDSLSAGLRRALVVSNSGAELVGTHTIGAPPTPTALRQWKPDCILYIGRLGVAQTLLHSVRAQQLLVILSDSVVQSRQTNAQLLGFNLVRITYPIDAVDFNAHNNVYGEDAFTIAAQIIGDLNVRGGDLRMRLKSWLHLESDIDIRRSLLKIMKDNAASRTWYRSASDTPYVFRGHRRFSGMFHVWELRESATEGSTVVDVDGWHPPRMPPRLSKAE